MGNSSKKQDDLIAVEEEPWLRDILVGLEERQSATEAENEVDCELYLVRLLSLATVGKY